MDIKNTWEWKIDGFPSVLNGLTIYLRRQSILLVEREMFLLDVGRSRKGDIPNRCRLGGICDYTEKVMSSM